MPRISSLIPTTILLAFTILNALTLRGDHQVLLLLGLFVAVYGLTGVALSRAAFTALLWSALAGGAASVVWWLSGDPSMRSDSLILPLSSAVLLGSAALLGRADPRPRVSAFLIASVLMGAILAYSSGDAGGPDGMIAWLRQVFGWDVRTAEIATIVFRKFVHFTYFGLIGWTAYRGALRFEVSPVRAARFALGWTLAFAAYDEISQLASPVRSGSALDVLLDLAGAATWVWLASRRRSKTSTAPSP